MERKTYKARVTQTAGGFTGVGVVWSNSPKEALFEAAFKATYNLFMMDDSDDVISASSETLIKNGKEILNNSY